VIFKLKDKGKTKKKAGKKEGSKCDVRNKVEKSLARYYKGDQGVSKMSRMKI